jgi:eukaryotic-like serine/threonine-protein kinase
LLKGNANSRNPLDWSPDNKFLLFGEGDLQSSGQLWLLPIFGDRKPIPLTQNQFVVSGAKFSPDGRWLAYSSNDSGRQEVYVTSFRDGSGKWQISTTGGVQPMWRRDGKELFYWSADNGLMAVSITLKKDGVETGSPHQLFRFNNPVGIVGVVSPYDFTPDGQRFVLLTTPEDKPRTVTLLTDWTVELKKR